jgi:hypothetical protein
MNLGRLNPLKRRVIKLDTAAGTSGGETLRKVNPRSFSESLQGKRSRVVSDGATSIWKPYVVVFVSAVAAFGAGYLLSVKSFSNGALVLLAFAVIFVAQTVLLRRLLDIVLASALGASGLTVFFINQIPTDLAVYLASGLGLLFLLAHFNNRRETENMLHLRFFKAARSGAGLFLIAISIYIGVVLFVNGEAFFAERNVSRMVDVVGKPALWGRVEGFSAGMNLGEFLSSYTRGQINKDLVPGISSKAFKKLSPKKQEVVLDEVVAELSRNMGDYLKYELRVDQSIAANVQGLLSKRVEALPLQSQPLRLALVILVLVLVVKGVEFLLLPALTLLSLVIYELLLGVGFATVRFESCSREVFSLP